MFVKNRIDIEKECGQDDIVKQINVTGKYKGTLEEKSNIQIKKVEMNCATNEVRQDNDVGGQDVREAATSPLERGGKDEYYVI